MNRIDPVNIMLASDTERDFEKEVIGGSGAIKWVQLGEHDDRADYIDDLYNNSTTHNSLTKSIIDMIYADGFSGTEQILEEKFQGVTGYERLLSLCGSIKKHGGAFLEVIKLTGGGYDFTVGKYNHYRLEPKTEVEKNVFEVANVYYSKDFKNPTGKNTPEKLPIFKEGVGEKSILFIQIPLGDKQYYSDPDYWGGRRYIELEDYTSTYHVNELLNGFMPSGLLSILSGIEEDKAERQKQKNNITRNLAGVQNAGKLIVEWSNGTDQAMKWTPFTTEDLQERYKFLADECRTNIMIAHRVVNPIGFGINTGTGFSNNADETDTSLEVFKERIISKFRYAIINGLKPLFPTIAEKQTEVLSKQNGVKLSREFDSIALRSDSVEDYYLLWEDEVDETPRKDSYYIDGISNNFRAREENETWLNSVFTKLTKKDKITSDPDSRDSRDFGFYKVLYKYDHPKPKNNSRDFCIHMHEEHQDTMFRRDDIDQMSKNVVNDEFGRYDIFKFKGSYNCRGRWKRLVYFLKRVPAGKIVTVDGVEYRGGQFLPMDKLKHFDRVGNIKNVNPIVHIEDKEAGSVETQQVHKT